MSRVSLRGCIFEISGEYWARRRVGAQCLARGNCVAGPWRDSRWAGSAAIFTRQVVMLGEHEPKGGEW